MVSMLGTVLKDTRYPWSVLEIIVTVQGVLLTSCMESIIVNTMSNNSSKGTEVKDTWYLCSALEMIVTVQVGPLTSYMEGIIVKTVSNNSNKGRAITELVVEKLS